MPKSDKNSFTCQTHYYNIKFANLGTNAVRYKSALRTTIRILTILAIYAIGLQPFTVAGQSSGSNTDSLKSIFEKADILARSSQYESAINSLADILANTDDDILKINACVRMSDIFFMTGNADQAMYYANYAKQIPAIKKNPSLLFRINNIIGSIFLSQNQIAKCDSIIKISSSQLHKVSDREALAKFFYLAGKYAFASNDYITGIRVLQRASMQYSKEIITDECCCSLPKCTRLKTISILLRKTHKRL